MTVAPSDVAKFRDVCGLAATQQEGSFVITTGAGAIHRVDAGAGVVLPIHSALSRGSHWDNHLVRFAFT